MTLHQKTKLRQLGDKRGNLVAIEAQKEVPFDIKRVYYIYNTREATPRGFHAHKELNQFLVCVSGSCKIIMDDGSLKQEIVMNSAAEGIFIDKMIWHEMFDFTSDCLLLVLCDDLYFESDYIRDYNEFLKCIKTIAK